MCAEDCRVSTVKKVYRAANLPEAHLLRGLLAQAGIEALVFNENAQGGVGQLPFTEAWPEVWVAQDRDLARARDIVQSFEARSANGADLRCSRCAEDNPGSFQSCWNCGASLG
jgi:Putative prokaryotic signal transducing protein